MSQYKINHMIITDTNGIERAETVMVIDSNSPINALKKFFRLHCLSTGFYEFHKSKVKGNAYMSSSFGVYYHSQLIRKGSANNVFSKT